VTVFRREASLAAQAPTMLVLLVSETLLAAVLLVWLARLRRDQTSVDASVLAIRWIRFLWAALSLLAIYLALAITFLAL